MGELRAGIWIAVASLCCAALAAACSGEVTPTDAASHDSRGAIDGLSPGDGAAGGCSAGSCAQGCCAGNQCQPWSQGYCGATGQPAEPCVQCSGSCQQGRCVTSSGKCGAHNCDGCCELDVCLGGVQLSACGTNGAPCAMCTPPQACKQGRCQ